MNTWHGNLDYDKHQQEWGIGGRSAELSIIYTFRTKDYQTNTIDNSTAAFDALCLQEDESVAVYTIADVADVRMMEMIKSCESSLSAASDRNNKNTLIVKAPT